MTSAFPQSPRVLRGGIVLVDPGTAAVIRVVALQYNPDSLTRSLAIQAVGEGADREEALRLKGPPIETIKLEAELDATDQLEMAQPGDDVLTWGLLPQLAALETVIYPTSAQLLANDALAQVGTLEIAPMEAPLTLFVWSISRVLPVRITDMTVTEEAFDTNLNPIRAKISVGMRVLSVDDLGFQHRGGNLFLLYQQQKERLALKAPLGSIGGMGLMKIA
jgi:hypothetical protein